MQAVASSFPDIHEERLPGPLRVVFAVFGLLALVLPIVEFWPAIWPMNFATPFFLLIICGAASVGLPMFAAAASDVGTRWTLESHALRIEFLGFGFARNWKLHHAQGSTAELHVDEEAQAPLAHRVVVRDRTGKHFFSPPFPTKAQAEAYLSRVKARLGVR